MASQGAQRTEKRTRRADQLAPGRHGMSREKVEANQSRRIFAAMSELIVEHGYEPTTVELVIVRAGVSRTTFYRLRGGRKQWFAALCEAASGRLMARLEGACEGASAAERPGRAAKALVDFCHEDPVGARICFVETLAANTKARAWREELLDRIAATIALGVDGTDAPRTAARADGSAEHDELAARAAVGAVLELAGRRPEQLDREYATALVTTMLARDRR